MGLLIHEVAKQAEISKDTVKKAEQRGFITSTRDVNGWRRYGPEAVVRLKKLYAPDARDAEEESNVRRGMADLLADETGSVLAQRGIAKKPTEK